MTELHENDTSTKPISDAGALPKTVFEREAEPLGLSLVNGPHGVALGKDGQSIALEDAFPGYYTNIARERVARFGEVWGTRFTYHPDNRENTLGQLYEALGAIAYRAQFSENGRLLAETTRGVLCYFYHPDRPAYDEQGNRLAPDHWRNMCNRPMRKR